VTVKPIGVSENAGGGIGLSPKRVLRLKLAQVAKWRYFAADVCLIYGYFSSAYGRVSGNSSNAGDNSIHAIPIITTRD